MVKRSKYAGCHVLETSKATSDDKVAVSSCFKWIGWFLNVSRSFHVTMNHRTKVVLAIKRRNFPGRQGISGPESNWNEKKLCLTSYFSAPTGLMKTGIRHAVRVILPRQRLKPTLTFDFHLSRVILRALPECTEASVFRPIRRAFFDVFSNVSGRRSCINDKVRVSGALKSQT